MATLAELGVKKLFKEKSFKAKVKECFARFDTNSDGRISFTEFVKFYNWFLKEAQSLAQQSVTNTRSQKKKQNQWNDNTVSQKTNASKESMYPQIKPQLKPQRSAGATNTVQCFTLQKDPVLGFGIHFEETSFDQQQARDCEYQIRPGQQYLVVKETRDAGGRVGPATLQGILPGDVLLRVERQPAQNFAQFSDICQNRRTLFMEMLRIPAKGTSKSMLAQVGRSLHGAAVSRSRVKSEGILPGIGQRFRQR